MTGSRIVLPFNLPLSTILAHRIGHLVAPEQTCLNRFSLFLTLKNQLFYWHGCRRDMTRVNKQTVCLWVSEQSSKRLINVYDPLCRSSVCFLWAPRFLLTSFSAAASLRRLSCACQNPVLWAAGAAFDARYLKGFHRCCIRDDSTQRPSPPVHFSDVTAKAKQAFQRLTS